MKNISLYVIVDNLFKFILLFLFNLVWCLYFIQIPWACICVSALISIILLLIFNNFGSRQKNRKLKSLSKQQHIEDVKNAFLLMSTPEILTFFNGLVKTKHNCKVEENYIVIETSGLPILLYPYYKHSSFTADDLLLIYKQVKHLNLKRLIVLTNSIEANANTITNGFKFETMILDYKQTYSNLLQEYEFYPPVTKQKAKAKNTFKQLLAISLNKKKTKGYLLSALFIFFASFFVSYKVYYLLFSSFLIGCAIFSYFNPTFNLSKKTNILD